MRKTKLAKVFDGVRNGKSLYASCVYEGISTKDFYKMIGTQEGAKEEFLLALNDYADQCMDDIRSLANSLKEGNIDTSTAKLLIETQKWLAQKVTPEQSGTSIFGADEENIKSREIVVKFI